MAKSGSSGFPRAGNPEAARLEHAPEIRSFEEMTSDVHEAPNGLSQLLAAASRPIAQRVFGLTAAGLEHVPPMGGYILCANHLRDCVHERMRSIFATR